MSESNYVFEVDQSSFASRVIEASYRQPVLVDFWAEWCAPCRSLMPLLAKLAEEFQGQFLLAKVNSDENQELALEFGVRSLPTVKLFRDGMPVDEFMGAIPEGQLREFLDRHIERESDRVFASALEAFSRGDREQALQLMERAHQMEPEKSRITLGYAGLLAEVGDFAGAESMLDQLPIAEQVGDEVVALRARLQFSGEADDLPAREQLQRQADGGDLESLYQLAVADVNAGAYEPAMENLLVLMRKDRSFREDIGRTTLLKLFAMLGDDPLVERYRRKMMTALY
ncbi:MAG: thioredoxin [Gammaproteobacteria bacterium]|nr:thioredoxin [Gammaproteobacteria bacterium]